MGRLGNKSCLKSVAFWVLIAAWISANNPQAAVVATVSWIQEAHRRSSHENLNLTVAQLLSGQTHAPAPEVESRRAERDGKVPVVAHFTLKKLELASESTSNGLVPQRPAFWPHEAAALSADSMTYPPLLGPPRGELG